MKFLKLSSVYSILYYILNKKLKLNIIILYIGVKVILKQDTPWIYLIKHCQI